MTYDPTEVAAYIQQAAQLRGIDPTVALKVAESEGLHGYIGDENTSFGPFQLHYGSGGRGFAQAGLGNDFTRDTGLDARDPNTWRQQVDYALDHAKKEGWGAWYGARKVGITGKMGIGKSLSGDTKFGETAAPAPVTTAPAEAAGAYGNIAKAMAPYMRQASGITDSSGSFGGAFSGGYSAPEISLPQRPRVSPLLDSLYDELGLLSI